MARLLIAEDDAGIRAPLVRALEREGHEVEAVADGIEAARRGVADGHELLVLDVGLPGLDGFEVCRRVRAERQDVPVIFLTARTAEGDAITGLDAGGDDYVTKPFRVAELLARVRAQLRRVESGDAERELAAGDLWLDVVARRAWRGDEPLELTRKEFDLLAYLMRHAGETVRRERIMAAVWDANWYGSTKTLDMHMSWLRRKLGPEAAGSIITVRGVGFRLDP